MGESVPFRVTEGVLSIGPRRRQQLIRAGSLMLVGDRRISVESILRYAGESRQGEILDQISRETGEIERNGENSEIFRVEESRVSGQTESMIVAQEQPKLTPVHRAAKALGLPSNQVRRLASRQEIPGIALGSKWFLPTAWVRSKLSEIESKATQA